MSNSGLYTYAHTYKHLPVTHIHTKRKRHSDRDITYTMGGTGQTYRPILTSSDWPGALYVVEGDLEFLILVSLPLECW